jgi:hypothetical protein
MKKLLSSIALCLGLFAVPVFAQTSTITVNSTNPTSGVAIVAQTADNNNSKGGTTALTLVYNNGLYIELTAPATSTGGPFSGWTGCYYTSGTMCLVYVTANQTVTAGYGGTTAAVITPGPTYAFPPVAATGPVAPYLSFKSTTSPTIFPPVTYTIDWSITGTAPSACTAEVDGSSDGANWYTLLGGITCTSVGFLHVNVGPSLYVRVKMLTFTGTADSVTFNFTNGGPISFRTY